MRHLLAALLLVGAVVACDSGPSGPGELTGTVRSEAAPLGGAVLEVVGKGITGFSGAGSTHVYYSETTDENSYRVVLLASSPGDLVFTVSVEDKGGKRPQASIVNLTGESNLPIPATSDYTVAFTRKK